MGSGFSSNKNIKTTIIFDLDGTLVKTFTNKPICESFHIKVDNQDVWVSKRPGVDILLNFCESKFNIAIWSSGTKEYIDEIVKKCLNFNFLFIYNRSHCINKQGIWLKPLSTINNNKNNTIIIENNIDSILDEDYDNGIIVPSFNPFIKDDVLFCLKMWFTTFEPEEYLYEVIKPHFFQLTKNLKPHIKNTQVTSNKFNSWNKNKVSTYISVPC